MPNDTGRNLIFTSAGDLSKHRMWSSGAEPNFDLFLCYYGTQDGQWQDDAQHYLGRPGTKFENFAHVYDTERDILNTYDRIFILDDDIEITAGPLNDMFAQFARYDLWLAQPSYAEGSQARWPITRQQTGNLLRFTNFVEVGVTMWKTSEISRVIQLYRETRSGWGLDMLLTKVLGEPKDKIAVFDNISCKHPARDEPEMNKVMTRLDMQAEGRALLAKYGGSLDFKAVEHSAIPMAEGDLG